MKPETFNSYYNKIRTYGHMGFFIGDISVKDIVTMMNALHHQDMQKINIIKSMIEEQYQIVLKETHPDDVKKVTERYKHILKHAEEELSDIETNIRGAMR